jgi:transcriptional regulator with XRE-family HTH domain
MSIVSNNIKYLRRLNGMTQEQFARRIGIKRPSVGAYEEARAHPPYDTLISMAKLFGVTIDQLIKSDLRKVRETPNLEIASSSLASAVAAATAPPPPVAPVRAMAEPQPIATVVEKFYRDEEKEIRLVAQKVALKRVTFQPTRREWDVPTPRTSEPALPVFNTNVETASGQERIPDSKHEVARPAELAMVRQQQADEYARNHREVHFLNQLPTLQLPNLPAGTLRAFEAGKDFQFPGAWLVGQFVPNWYDLEDGRHYVFVVPNRGILYRRVYSQVKIRGTLLLSADDPSTPSLELPLRDVLEAWEVKAFVSYEVPKPGLPVERLRGLVKELEEELNRS